jgi:hypothetical protein
MRVSFGLLGWAPDYLPPERPKVQNFENNYQKIFENFKPMNLYQSQSRVKTTEPITFKNLILRHIEFFNP